MKITIGGVDYTPYLTLPVTVQTTLNDQLDTAVLMLRAMRKRDPFLPFTPVTFEEDGVSKSFYLAIDDVKELLGRRLYDHSITLIEQTKIAERILMESKAFTQPLVRDYADGRSIAGYTFFYFEKKTDGSVITEVVHEDTLLDGYLYSPITRKGSITIPLAGKRNSATTWIILGNIEIETQLARITVSRAKEYGGTETQIYNKSASDIDLASQITVTSSFDGCYIIRIYDGKTSDENHGNYYEIPIYAVSAPPIRSDYTIGDVVNILLDVAEPLREGLDTPRYRVMYNDRQADEVMTAKAPPQLLFSGGRSLWENLREVGRIIHAIPRITGDVITFDDLGSSMYADLSRGKRFGFSDSYNAADYTAALETTANNLINAEDISEGAVTEPFAGGYKSLRASIESVRIKDETGLISTTYPVEKIVSLRYRYKTASGTVISGDITPYVFERSEYDLLSSFSGGYPFSKTYGIYYTQGSQDIDGLWYRAEDSGTDIFNAFERPAIVNIIAAAAGISPSRVSTNYPEMMFEVSYITTVTARVRQHRTNYDGADELVMAYNQSANRLSSRAFGEALRGQVAMMGTTSSSARWLFRKFSDVPEAGLLYDADNYIASVTTQIYRDHCVSQIDLSTGYNEMGAYAEMQNAIRQYEIPAGEERYTLLEEFCDLCTTYGNDDGIVTKYDFHRAIVDTLGGSEVSANINLAAVSTFDGAGIKIADDLLLPVVSYAIGTSLYFGFRFENNYSAGRSSEAAPTAGAKYRLQKDVPYGDEYYSTAEKLSFRMFAQSTIADANKQAAAHILPANYANIRHEPALITLGDYPLIWHKDSADSGNVAVQVHFVSSEGYIIGSGLARACPFTRGSNTAEAARIYFFADRINQLTGTTDTASAVASSDLTVGTLPVCVKVATRPTVPFKSWAVIRGGDFVFGQNSETYPETVYFRFKRRR